MASKSRYGNPANYNTTPATRTDGDASALEVDVNGNLKVALSSDIALGQVELKDADSTAQANIKAANTARTTATNVLATQPIDAAGNVLSNGPPAVVGLFPTNVSSTAYETSHVLKNTAGGIFHLEGYNSKGSGQFIQLHNSATLPADTGVPVVTFYVPANSNFSLDYPKGRWFTTGIVVTNSSTGATKTIGSADCWFDAQII